MTEEVIVTNDELAALIAKVNQVKDALAQVSELIHPVRPVASDVSFQMMQNPDLSAEEGIPGVTLGEAAEQAADGVEALAAQASTVAGNLELLASSLRDIQTR